jgi:cation diffusion facilitator family transporter
MSITKIATIVSSLTAFLLLIIKLIIWLISWSISVLSSAIDSLLDLFVSIFNYVAIKNSEKPQDKTFNYWRWKIEALASLFEWIIITISWFYILYQSILKLINKETISFLWISIIVMIISFFITLLLVLFLQ